MAEGMMNPNGQDELMLVQSFEQLANAVGAEVPVSIQSEIAAVKAGNRMSSELQKILAEGSMKMMNQLNPETINSYQVDGGTESMTPSNMESLRNSGQITEDEYTYMVDGQPQAMTPSQMGGMQSSGAITPTPAPSNVMNMDDAIAAGLVNPTRPQARPAPMRPQARPMR